MKYYYFPSTFFGFRGRGYYGGGYTGYGYMVAGSAGGEIVETKKVDPKKLNKLLPPGDKELLEASEETGAPTVIPKKSWSWWSTLGNVAKEGVKTLGSATGSFIKNTGWSAKDLIEAYNLYKNPVGALERLAGKAIETAPSFLKIFGLGYKGGKMRRRKMRRKGCGMRGLGVCNMMGCGRPHLIKGSPEAKQYMAYLRSLRRR